MSNEVQIEPMPADQLSYAVDGALREGWNPGVSDATSFVAADPGGFLLARLDGRPAGCIAAVRYDDHFGFLGLYIVEPELRGRGIGTLLWARAIEQLGDRIVGLDGVVAMQDAYRLSGFVLAHRNVRYAGLTPVAPAVPDSVAEFEPGDFDEVAAYDAGCFGAERRGFLRTWTSQPGTRCYVSRCEGQVSGFTVVRPCHDGFKIAPLFADDSATARDLFSAASSHLPAGSVRIIDVPEPNSAARVLADDAGMSPVFETARMYRNGDPALPLSRIYGITSFELG